MDSLTATNALLALAAGLATFASPCMLPLVPGYLAMLGASQSETASPEATSGSQVAANTKTRDPLKRNSLLFVAGFTLVFTILGFGSGFLGAFLVESRRTIEIVGGILIVLFGVVLLISDKLPMTLQNRQGAKLVRPNGSGLSALTFGVVFAAAWSPCIGPTLGSILSLAASGSNPASGAVLLTIFSLGVGVPFLALSFGAAGAKRLTDFLKRHQLKVKHGSATVMVAFGLLMASGLIGQLSTQLSSIPGIEL